MILVRLHRCYHAVSHAFIQREKNKCTRFMATRAECFYQMQRDGGKMIMTKHLCCFRLRARNDIDHVMLSLSLPTPSPLSPHRRPFIKFSTFAKSEYIHPLSQIVLEYLQSHHSQWVTRMGLDTGLKLNKDGTFALRFPPSSNGAIDITGVDAVTDGSLTEISGSIW